jgi:hypothetical protein
MNLDKSTKRIAKRVNKGFCGYPQITLTYCGNSPDCATEVVVGYIADENTPVQEQHFSGSSDVRKDETIQTTLLKIIERVDAKTVTQTPDVLLK